MTRLTRLFLVQPRVMLNGVASGRVSWHQAGRYEVWPDHPVMTITLPYYESATIVNPGLQSSLLTTLDKVTPVNNFTTTTKVYHGYILQVFSMCVCPNKVPSRIRFSILSRIHVRILHLTMDTIHIPHTSNHIEPCALSFLYEILILSTAGVFSVGTVYKCVFFQSSSLLCRVTLCDPNNGRFLQKKHPLLCSLRSCHITFDGCMIF